MCGMRILFLFLGYRCVYLVSKHDEQQDRINRNIHILKPIVNMETGSISVSIFIICPVRQYCAAVEFHVSGMILTSSHPEPQLFTVRLMPPRVIEPFGITCRLHSSENEKRQQWERPRSATLSRRASVSTCPLTRCPPRRSPRARALSRFTLSPLERVPSMVQDNVSSEA